MSALPPSMRNVLAGRDAVGATRQGHGSVLRWLERIIRATLRRTGITRVLKKNQKIANAIEKINERTYSKNKTLATLHGSLKRKDAKIDRLNAKVVAWRNQAKRKQFQVSRLKTFAAYYSENRPTNLYLRFARQAFDAAEALEAEVYVAHGVQALPAADIVARTVGGRLVCDANEVPSFAGRSIKTTWHPTNLAFLDLAFESYLRRCNAIMTVGWALKVEIDHYGPPVQVIPNYRPAETLVRSDRLRDWCGLRTGDELALAISSIVTGFEDVIEGLALLPDNVHLAIVGRIVPESYRDKIMGMIDERRLGHRVHVFPPVPYEELTSTASGADVGLAILDPAIMNHRISLPNRIFDYMFSGLPVCCPEIPDIVRLVQERDMGVVVPELNGEGWARAISSALERKAEMSRNALAASKEMIWESLEEPLYEALGRPGSVTFFGFSDLTKNNRTMRMAGSLSRRGTKVTICTYGDQAPPGMGDNVRFHLFG